MDFIIKSFMIILLKILIKMFSIICNGKARTVGPKPRVSRCTFGKLHKVVSKRPIIEFIFKNLDAIK